ncbi:MAG: efflux RND transporter permease subunit [Gammaproteobacteria bacterium]|nr:efflux RND transporter permease subunit [Gammaproteobacteria bacterium]
MKRMIAWFATNHVAANLVMGFAVLAGLASLDRVPVKLYPDFDVPLIVVTVAYLGAAPEEVETGVCARIEERIEGITGIKEIRSVSAEGLCTVHAELLVDVDRAQTLGEVENHINAIDTFPEEAERPIVQLAMPNNVVAEVAITGPSDERALKELGRRVRDDILALPGITHAALVNVRPYEISVEVSETSLSRNNLTFDDVAAALRERSLDLPGGSVKTEQGEFLLRTAGQAYWSHELENLLVTTRRDGTRVLVRDVARVVDGFEDTGQALKFDGKPAALVQVSRVGNQDVRQISETVRQYVSRASPRYGEGVELTIWRDESIILSERMRALLDSGIQGLLLVLVLLALFLRPHLALWVALGIPIAFLGAIFLIYWSGLSINSVSVMGFILALGMLVDDAVVVGEAAYTAQRRGVGQLAGAIEGAQHVLVPVTFGVITTVVAFLPLLFGGGTVGQAYGVMAATVICCLVFSLIECQTVLPAHLGHGSDRLPLGDFGLTFLAVVVVAAIALTPDVRSGAALAAAGAGAVFAAHFAGALSRLGSAFARLQVLFESGLTWVIEYPFRRCAEVAFRRRLVTLVVALGAMASAASLVSGGHLPFSLRTPQKGDSITARLTMPMGASEATMATAVGMLSESALEVQRQLEEDHGEGVVLHILEGLGGHFAAGTRVGFVVNDTGAHLGEVTMQLTPGEDRAVTTDAVAARWRDNVRPIADAVELSFVTDRIASQPDIDIRIAGTRWDDLRAVAAAIRTELGSIPGVYDIGDSLNTGKAELKLSVTPAGEALGVSLSDLGRQVRQAFYGEEAQRVQRGPDDIRIMVRYSERERQSLESLYALRLRTPAGGEVPFATVAEVEAGRGFSSIGRTNGTRYAWVTAEVDPTATSAAAVLAALDAGFLKDAIAPYPGVSYWFRSAQEQTDLIASLGPLFLFVLLAIYALLAMPLRSYTQPLIIMSVLPFALVGALWGHALLKVFGFVHGLSAASLFGVVAASGVVVNATLVLIHGVNRFRAAGDTLFDALVNSAVSRFRPILITTVTTFAGLAPLMFSGSTQAQLLVPMATSLAFGILLSSFAALMVVPALWLAMNDIGSRTRRVTDLVGTSLGGSPRLSTWMSRYPYVQESLRTREFTDLELPDDLDLEPREATIARQGLVRLYYEREFDAEAMRAQFGALAAKAPMTDDLVREARTWAEQRTFQLGVHMARGTMPAVDAARPLTDILCTCLGALALAAKREFEADQGVVPNGRVALVALDAAGRREFATGAPLRLLFVYDHDAFPKGLMPLTPEAWHGQLLRRLMLLIRNLSPEGILYEAVPAYALGAGQGLNAHALTRLRQHFADVPPAADLRMLTHARVIEAEEGLGEEFEDLRRAALSGPHDLEAIARDVATARQSPLRLASIGRRDDWTIGPIEGGLDDIVLAAEYLQLVGAAPTKRVNTLAETFEAARESGSMDAGAARDLTDAALLWRNLDGFFRMTCGGAFDPQSATAAQRAIVAEMCGVASFAAASAKVAETARRSALHLQALWSLASSPVESRAP